MYFAKNELIDLNDNTQYLILDTIYLNETTYYKVEKIENNSKTGIINYIKAINNEGKLYIDNNIDENIIEQIKNYSA